MFYKVSFKDELNILSMMLGMNLNILIEKFRITASKCIVVRDERQLFKDKNLTKRLKAAKQV